MHKIIVFDLDGTLAPIGKGMKMEDICALQALEEAGYRIAICSGKPTYYLCGFLRQIGLKHPIMVGENGAVIQYGVDLPPKIYNVHPYSELAKVQIEKMKKLIDESCGDGVWYQPNEVGLTPFIQKQVCFDIIQKLIDENEEDLSELFVYRHVDCYDLVPKNISKRSGLEMLANMEGLTASDFVAVGDGINDVPMFEFADLSIVIGNNLKYEADFRFETISQALEYLGEMQS